MVNELQYASSSEPFRWKLFLLVVLVVGSITAAAIILTLIANPPHGSMHIPTVQPIARLAPTDSHAPIGLEFAPVRRG